MTAPILKKGDLIHVAYPGMGDRETDTKNAREAAEWYLQHGVRDVLVTTCLNATTGPQVIAVIRD